MHALQNQDVVASSSQWSQQGILSVSSSGSEGDAEIIAFLDNSPTTNFHRAVASAKEELEPAKTVTTTAHAELKGAVTPSEAGQQQQSVGCGIHETEILEKQLNPTQRKRHAKAESKQQQQQQQVAAREPEMSESKGVYKQGRNWRVQYSVHGTQCFTNLKDAEDFKKMSDAQKMQQLVVAREPEKSEVPGVYKHGKLWYAYYRQGTASFNTKNEAETFKIKFDAEKKQEKDAAREPEISTVPGVYKRGVKWAVSMVGGTKTFNTKNDAEDFKNKIDAERQQKKDAARKPEKSQVPGVYKRGEKWNVCYYGTAATFNYGTTASFNTKNEAETFKIKFDAEKKQKKNAARQPEESQVPGVYKRGKKWAVSYNGGGTATFNTKEDAENFKNRFDTSKKQEKAAQQLLGKPKRSPGDTEQQQRSAKRPKNVEILEKQLNRTQRKRDAKTESKQQQRVAARTPEKSGVPGVHQLGAKWNAYYYADQKAHRQTFDTKDEAEDWKNNFDAQKRREKQKKAAAARNFDAEQQKKVAAKEPEKSQVPGVYKTHFRGTQWEVRFFVDGKKGYQRKCFDTKKQAEDWKMIERFLRNSGVLISISQGFCSEFNDFDGILVFWRKFSISTFFETKFHLRMFVYSRNDIFKF